MATLKPTEKQYVYLVYSREIDLYKNKREDGSGGEFLPGVYSTWQKAQQALKRETEKYVESLCKNNTMRAEVHFYSGNSYSEVTLSQKTYFSYNVVRKHGFDIAIMEFF
jgi:hypothetical protein